MIRAKKNYTNAQGKRLRTLEKNEQSYKKFGEDNDFPQHYSFDRLMQTEQHVLLALGKIIPKIASHKKKINTAVAEGLITFEEIKEPQDSTLPNGNRPDELLLESLRETLKGREAMAFRNEFSRGNAYRELLRRYPNFFLRAVRKTLDTFYDGINASDYVETQKEIDARKKRAAERMEAKHLQKQIDELTMTCESLRKSLRKAEATTKEYKELVDRQCLDDPEKQGQMLVDRTGLCDPRRHTDSTTSLPNGNKTKPSAKQILEEDDDGDSEFEEEEVTPDKAEKAIKTLKKQLKHWRRQRRDGLEWDDPVRHHEIETNIRICKGEIKRYRFRMKEVEKTTAEELRNLIWDPAEDEEFMPEEVEISMELNRLALQNMRVDAPKTCKPKRTYSSSKKKEFRRILGNYPAAEGLLDSLGEDAHTKTKRFKRYREVARSLSKSEVPQFKKLKRVAKESPDTIQELMEDLYKNIGRH
jgi:hypothetical protein